MKILWIAGLLLMLRIPIFARSFQGNAGVLAVVRWGLSGSLCSSAGTSQLKVAEEALLGSANGSTQQDRLLGRIAYFKEVCVAKTPVNVVKLCLSLDVSSLPLQGINQALAGEDGWTLKAYWVDSTAIQLNEAVPVVLAWEVSNPHLLDALPEKQVVSTTGDPWCGWREGNTLWQVGVARNRLWNGGFEWNFMEPFEFPANYTTDLKDYDTRQRSISIETAIDLYALHTQVACLRSRGPSYVGLYQIFPLEPGELLYFQGGTGRTEAGARADVGGFLELPNVRYPAFAARRADTDGNWLPFAQLVELPDGATHFSFRVAYSGNSGVACFDGLFVLPIAPPDSLFRRQWYR